MFNTMVTCWWWKHMFKDTTAFAKCPECAITTSFGRRSRPPLHPIPVQRPFQILGIDVMDLPLTERGNGHAVVIQDLFTKWPFVFALPDQKALRILGGRDSPLVWSTGGLTLRQRCKPLVPPDVEHVWNSGKYQTQHYFIPSTMRWGC